MIRAVLYLAGQVAWGLLDRLQPQDQPAAVRPYNPAAVRAEIQRNLRKAGR